jgi:alkanesulfonate monooxygenase SsuD/methylene tetrahydromethanopterin reductase-like flavin-dependent oxidoreductase (luciferase family)
MPRPTFGLFLTPAAGDLEAVLDLARRADEGGLDLIGIQDHPYQRAFLDTWVLMATVLARTERISVFPDVANLPLRPPPMLAKAAASLDVLSGGRFELGLGSGAFWDAIVAMGGPRRTPGEAIAALREAIELIRLAWRADGAVRYDGTYYSADGYKPGPAPAHDIGIWLGAYGPRMLRLTGELADGWVPSMTEKNTPERLGELGRIIDEAAAAAGRDPAAIRRIWNVNIRVDDAGALAEQLTTWSSEHNVDTFVLWPQGDDVDRQVDRYISEVAPAVRARAGA